MSYGDNLITNPDAETGDTTGWTATNVTVVEGTVDSVIFKPTIVDAGEWMEEVSPEISHVGDDGTHYFNLAPSASLSQTILAADLTPLPDFDFKIDLDFKLSTTQDLDDATVKGWLEAEVLYSDESVDLYIIPCVLGVMTTDRELTNYWLRATANILLREGLNLTSIKITIKTLAS